MLSKRIIWRWTMHDNLSINYCEYCPWYCAQQLNSHIQTFMECRKIIFLLWEMLWFWLVFKCFINYSKALHCFSSVTATCMVYILNDKNYMETVHFLEELLRYNRLYIDLLCMGIRIIMLFTTTTNTNKAILLSAHLFTCQLLRVQQCQTNDRNSFSSNWSICLGNPLNPLIHYTLNMHYIHIF